MWWPRRGESVGDGDTGRGSVRSAVKDRVVERGSNVRSTVVPRQAGGSCAAITPDRLASALDELDVRHVRNRDGALVAMWERFAVLFELEGADDEIVVIRARPHETVPGDWADRAYYAVNEWNYTRRFVKAYVGDLGEGRLPIYAEAQLSFGAGVHCALLVEQLQRAVSELRGFVEWLHEDGELL
jgi:hypothetical protein